VKPLPDILSTISKKFEASSSSSNAGAEESSGKQPEPFAEPEAPPNSVERVERSNSVYEDDEFHCETEDIELL